jgi:mannitol-1-phosphate/altronate dehydrogenase
MPEMMIDIPVKEVAKIIKVMTEQEIETLALLLTEKGAELLERKKDLELNRVKFLTRDEAFDV